MTFEEWWKQRKPRPNEFIEGDLVTLAAQAAWDYQQQHIDELESENKRILDHAVELCMTTSKGYVLVPVEPTEKMVEAGIMFHSQFDSSVPRVYKAMIQETQEQE